MKKKTEQKLHKDISVSVKNISKKFTIPHESINTLKGAFINIFHKKTFESFNALQDVSFEVKKGEFFGIIGRNGSGKSTLLKILAGVYTENSGTIKINGRISPFLELGIGFNPELSGRDNVYLNATVLGLSKKQIDEKFDSIVAFSELGRFIDQKLKNYSSGMQVRLSFSVAIHANREILLMDEVLAVGDANFQSKCLTEFNKYKEQGKTVILVTHDIGIVQKYCDRAMLLRNGKIEKIGDPEEVGNEYIYQNMSDEEKRMIKEKEIEIKQTEANIEKIEVKELEEKKELSHVDKKIEICGLSILNEKGKESLVLEVGKPFLIKLKVKFNVETRNITSAVAFRDSTDKNVLGIHSLYSINPIKIPKIEKNKIIEFSFSGEMPLTPGLFNLYADVSSNVQYPHYDLLYFNKNLATVRVFSKKILWDPIVTNCVVNIKEI